MSIATNVSSLQANQVFMNTNANNIANINTDGFIPSDTRMIDNKSSVSAINSQADDNGSTRSQTNLSKELPDQVVIGGVEEANVAAIKTQDEMFGSLLDIKA